MVIGQVIESVRNQTDLWPWYWFSYGEKCYAFVCSEAFPVDENDPYPTPGTELRADMENQRQWIGENGTKMLLGQTIANIEQQNGGTICRFIALAHAHLIKPLEEITHAESR